MVYPILKPMQKVTSPLLNEAGYGLSIDDMKRYISKRIMNQIKQSPELIGILDTVVTDHFQGPVDFFDIRGRPLGPTNLDKAKKFFDEKKVMEAFYGSGIDYFADGSMFGWYDSARFKLGEKSKEALASFDTSYSSTTLGLQIRDKLNEEMEMPRAIGYLAASSVEILHNEIGIYAYKQETSGKQVIWSPEQVVHVRLMDFNGEVRGFSGLKALSMEIAYMYMLKENIISKLMNGGSPDSIIALKNVGIGVHKSRFERLQTALESFSHLKKAHGNMPIDAEVDVIPMGEKLKDMEYRELAMFAISEFCLAVGVPTSRIPFLMTGSGGTTNKGELSGNSEDAYQKKINNRRARWEVEWNRVFRKAGFTFQFRRDNLQDDVRETQAATQRGAYVQSVLANLKMLGKQLTVEATLALLSGAKRNIDVEDIEDLDMELQQQMTNAAAPDKNDLKNTNTDLKGKVSQDRSDSKKKIEENGRK